MSTTIELPTVKEIEAVKPRSILEEMRFSAITFHTDVGRSDSAVIPIGVMAEIYVPKRVYAVGLIARTDLSSDELQFASELVKPLVAKPFKYLSAQFEKAWRTLAPGEVLAHLTAGHAYSAVHFSVPEKLPFYPIATAVALRASVRMQIGTLLDDRMSQLLEYEPTTLVARSQAKPREELMQLKEAA